MSKLMNYIRKFEECGIIRDEVIVIGNYKKGNKTKEITDRIFELAKNSEDKEEFYLTIFKTSKSPSAIISCCTDMMKLNIHPELARRRLEEIANSSGKSMSRFSASMFLREWDKGNITRNCTESKIKKCN